MHADPNPVPKDSNPRLLGKRTFRLQLKCLDGAGEVIERRVVQCKVGSREILLCVLRRAVTGSCMHCLRCLHTSRRSEKGPQPTANGMFQSHFLVSHCHD